MIISYLTIIDKSLLFKNELDFEDIKLPVKIRSIPINEQNNYISISVYGCENKKKYSIHVSTKYFEEKKFDLLFLEAKGKSHYVLIKYFNIFMYDHMLH